MTGGPGDHHHRGLLATVADVLHWLCNLGVTHARPPCDGDLLDDDDGRWPRAEVLKYGDLAQAAYGAFDLKTGASRYGLRRMLPAVGLAGHGYVATAFLYATVDPVPVLEADDHLHWMGFVAVADDAERDRTGYRDIVVVWRGTVGWEEWFKDVQALLVPIQDGGDAETRPATTTPAALRVLKVKARVEYGFQSLYASRCSSNTCREKEHGTDSAGHQVLAELRRLVTHFAAKHRGEKVRVTATGHSLGGALAVLTAWGAAELQSSGAGGAAGGRIPVRVVTFGAPRVGDEAFCNELLTSRGVKVLRVAIEQDKVPMLPLTAMGYVHAGEAFVINAAAAPVSSISSHSPWHFHSLKLYLSLLRGRKSPVQGERETPAPEEQEEDDDDSSLTEAELDQMISSDKVSRKRILNALSYWRL